MSFETSLLNEIPDVVSPENRARLLGTKNLSPMECVKLLEEMLETYNDSHPYFLVQLAENLILIGPGMIAVELYRKAQRALANMNVFDSELDKKVMKYHEIFERSTRQTLAASEKSTYTQVWTPTREHRFPITFPLLSPEAHEIKQNWEESDVGKDALFTAYLRKLTIDTSQVESVFRLTDESVLDLVQNGISEGRIETSEDSDMHDTEVIRRILQDTLSAYDLLTPLINHPDTLTPTIICEIHARVMNTCRYIGKQYTPPGRTRAETQKTVVVMGAYTIQCCPFTEVDKELEYICRMAKQWIRTWRNPIATASWVHLIFSNCYPFDDGNGRVARLVASIPLLRHGFPPIAIAFHQTTDYYDALRKARAGDHDALINSIKEGMREGIKYAKEAIATPPTSSSKEGSEERASQ
ncbi:hypothetical protein CPC08DRAFT_710728 [Agrocybe pediades]|nr:hypothetical protein CPC08DRAFT_710728 [Agrocybe pediades]